MNGKRPYMDYQQHRAELKRCSECGGAFLPKSNRGKHCTECAECMKRANAAKRKRKQKGKCKTLVKTFRLLFKGYTILLSFAS